MDDKLFKFREFFGDSIRDVFVAIKEYYFISYDSQIPEDWVNLISAEFEAKLYIVLMFAFYFLIFWFIASFFRKGVTLCKML